MQDSKIAYRRKVIPEGPGAGRAAGQLAFAANSECSVSKLICSRDTEVCRLSSYGSRWKGEFFRQGAGRGLFARAAQKAPLLAPRHPLPPPLSLNEEGVGLGDGFCVERSRTRSEAGAARKSALFHRYLPRFFHQRTGCGVFPSGGGKGAVRAWRAKGPLLLSDPSHPHILWGIRGNFAKNVVFAKFRCVLTPVLATNISAPRHPLPPPLSLHEEGVGLGDGFCAERGGTRSEAGAAWGKQKLKVERHGFPDFLILLSSLNNTD